MKFQLISNFPYNELKMGICSFALVLFTFIFYQFTELLLGDVGDVIGIASASQKSWKTRVVKAAHAEGEQG